MGIKQRIIWLVGVFDLKNIIVKLFSFLGFIFAYIIFILFFISPAYSHYEGVVLSGWGTAVIDGQISLDEWDENSFVEFPVNTPDGGVCDGIVYAMNDEENLYLAVIFNHTAVGNSAAFNFDNNHDGSQLSQGDDALIINPNPTVGFWDLHRFTGPPCPINSICSGRDSEFGGANDGSGVFFNSESENITIYEFSHPLNSEDDLHDFSLGIGDTVGFRISIRMLSTPNIADTYFPSVPVFGDIIITTGFLDVEIDIKPGSDQNSINMTSNGVIPVAIITTDNFDATLVDPLSVEFGPSGALEAHGKGHVEDVDEDGDLDLVLHFKTKETGINYGDIEAYLTGKTFEGQNIEGFDSINIVGNNVYYVVSSGAKSYSRPRINNNGEIVWSQKSDGYFVWSNLRGQISVGGLDRDPDINDNGEIIWRFGDGGQGPDGIMSNIRGLIYLEQGGPIDPYYDTHRINNNGEIVWSSLDEIYSNIRDDATAPTSCMYNLLSTDRGLITNDCMWQWLPDINDLGEIVWHQLNPSHSINEIWSNLRGRIASNGERPSINNSGEIVWQQWDGNDYEIYSNMRGQVTNNNVNDTNPHINNLGVITWLSNNSVMATFQ
jgi:hypothetical protein